MSILTRFTQQVQKYHREADQRAERKLQSARTSAERERAKAQIERERLKTKREVAQAKTALLKAEAAKKRAAKEVRDLGGGFSLEKLLFPKKRKATYRKTRSKARKRFV